MKAARFEQVSLSAYAWRQLLEIAEEYGIKHDSEAGRKIEDLAWHNNTSPLGLLELQGKVYRRYFSYEIHTDQYWGNMGAVFFMHCSNAQWWKARAMLVSMEDMASRYAAYPYGECPV